MGGFAGVAGALAGAGRGYEAAQGRNIPGPSQPSKSGLLMNYLNHRKQGQQAQQAGVDSSAMASLAPPPVGPNQGGGYSAMPSPSIAPPMVGAPAAPPQNQYHNPFGQPPNNPPSPPGFAQGKIVDKPTTAIIGEDGPEAVIPLNGRPDAKVSTANLPQMQYRRGGC